MRITPDTKDWTWVVRQQCPECGFDASQLAAQEIAPLIKTTAASWAEILGQPPEMIRRRVSDERWSPLEYACHVRDVFVLYQERLELILTQDDPTFPNWDQDETAVSERYNEQEPPVVREHLVDSAAVLATSFANISESEWERTGTRSDGAHFDLLSFGRYLVHDPVHHLFDVADDLEVLRAT